MRIMIPGIGAFHLFLGEKRDIEEEIQKDLSILNVNKLYWLLVPRYNDWFKKLFFQMWINMPFPFLFEKNKRIPSL